jgi:hypothetical protein
VTGQKAGPGVRGCGNARSLLGRLTHVLRRVSQGSVSGSQTFSTAGTFFRLKYVPQPTALLSFGNTV